MSSEDDGLSSTIDAPYLLALNAGLWISEDGGIYTDRLWAVDLLRHAKYLTNLTVLSPVYHRQPGPDQQRIPADAFRLVGYRHFGGAIKSYAAIPTMIALLLREVPRATVVHTCIAGLPFPVGWIVTPIARLFGKKIVITVESSFWRIPPGTKASLRRRLIASGWERINRWCLRQADYAAYPHDGYRQTLPAPRAGGGNLFQASWIDEEMILPAETVAARWNDRISSLAGARFLYAARMVPEKGTRVIAATLEHLEERGADVLLDIIGIGPDLEWMRSQAVTTDWRRRHVRVLEQINYGPAFFALLTNYDAVLVPNLSDEQPRIVYDAYSQGVSAIGSDVPGLAACVTDGETGHLVPPDDPAALADAIIAAALSRDKLRQWGMAGRERSTRFTHERMHRERCHGIQQIL